MSFGKNCTIVAAVCSVIFLILAILFSQVMAFHFLFIVSLVVAIGLIFFYYTDWSDKRRW
jgi:hypothetical protein